MSLEYWKREKNFRVLEKGYARDHEGIPFRFLLARLREETDELEVALINETGTEDMPVDRLYYGSQVEEIIKECADVSNLVDYIASKALTQKADKYDPKEVRG